MTKEIELNFSYMEDILAHSLNGEEPAYIKKENLNNNDVWSIYNVQGEKMGYAATREMAFAIAKQNSYTGTSVH